MTRVGNSMPDDGVVKSALETTYNASVCGHRALRPALSF